MTRTREAAGSSFLPRAGRADERGLGVAFAVALGFASVVAGVVPAGAADHDLVLSEPWMRMIIPQRPAAGYFTLTNNGGKEVELTGASSPGCGKMMLHKSVEENGVDKMLPVESIPVAPHKSISFAPRGLHLMCMNPTAGLAPGKSVPVTLKFKDGTTLKADFPVRNAAGK